ncbi:MAG: UvrD-helicase domain-containing protein [Kiritimatiellae bacterium]|nr:UvrD-helicase domain-containing protein [Kiritimatiellia bacterium]
MELDEEQLRVVEIDSGRHLVLAPPGAGKTEQLTRRVVRALEKGVPAKKIFCATFTVRAALEMRRRVSSAAAPGYRIPDIGNIHHHCMNFLFGRNIYTKGWQVIDEKMQSDLVAETVEEFRQLLQHSLSGGEEGEEAGSRLRELAQEYRFPDDPVFWRECDKSLSSWSYAIRPMRYLHERRVGIPYELRCDGSDIARNEDCSMVAVYELLSEHYEQLKREMMLLDFDDLLIESYVALKAGRLPPEEHFSWVLVDETQDLNPLQCELVRLFSSPDAVTVFFGDYEQSIFSFLGASRHVLERVEADCEIHYFSRNYRSPSYLMDLLARYSLLTLESPWRNLPAPVKFASAKGRIRLVDWSPAQCVANAVSLLRQEKTSEVALLVSSNRMADELDRIIRTDKNEDVGYIKVSGQELFQSKVMRDFMALQLLSADPLSRMAWSRVVAMLAPSGFSHRRARMLVGRIFKLGMLPSDFLEPDFNPLLLPKVQEWRDWSRCGRVVVFDTETTGLDHQRDEIIQLSAVEYIRGRRGRSFNRFLLARQTISSAAEAVHHISAAVLTEKGEPPAVVLRDFAEFISGDTLLVAHNLGFDYAMVNADFRRYNVDETLDACQFCDTLEFAHRLYPSLSSYRLGALISQFSLEGCNSHDALDDVGACGELFLYLAEHSEQFIAEQRTWLQENEKFVRRFHDDFAVYWSNMKSRHAKPSSFRFEMTAFLDFMVGNKFYGNGDLYDCDRKDLVEDAMSDFLARAEKFFRFTENGEYGEELASRPFSTFLVKHRSDLTRLKEVDLIVSGQDRLVVSTVHKSKGLQFETVILPDAEKYGNDKGDPDDEFAAKEWQRVLYVGMSRAERNLYVCGTCGGLDPVRRCFDAGYADYYVRKASGRREDLAGDWLFDFDRLSDGYRRQVWLPEFEPMLGSRYVPVRRMALLCLPFKRDRAGLVSACRDALSGNVRVQIKSVAVECAAKNSLSELVPDIRRACLICQDQNFATRCLSAYGTLEGSDGALLDLLIAGNYLQRLQAYDQLIARDVVDKELRLGDPAAFWRGVGRYLKPDNLLALRKAFQNASEIAIKLSILDIYAGFGFSYEVREALERAIYDLDGEVRKRAVEILSRKGISDWDRLVYGDILDWKRLESNPVREHLGFLNGMVLRLAKKTPLGKTDEIRIDRYRQLISAWKKGDVR